LRADATAPVEMFKMDPSRNVQFKTMMPIIRQAKYLYEQLALNFVYSNDTEVLK
jgi:hypothetical protein